MLSIFILLEISLPLGVPYLGLPSSCRLLRRLFLDLRQDALYKRLQLRPTGELGGFADTRCFDASEGTSDSPAQARRVVRQRPVGLEPRFVRLDPSLVSLLGSRYAMPLS